MNNARVDLVVNADFLLDGSIVPRGFIWPDNEKFYKIDKVTNVCRAASLKAGGAGMRYTCKCCGKVVHLFNEDGKWFMERNV